MKNSPNGIPHKAQWLHDELQFQLKYGFKTLIGYSIRFNKLGITYVEHPEIAAEYNGMIDSTYYVKSLYDTIYRMVGINEKGHAITRQLAMDRIFAPKPVIPSLGELMGLKTLPRDTI